MRAPPAAGAEPGAMPMDVDGAARPPVATVFDWDDTLCPSSWLHQRGLLAATGLLDRSPLTAAAELAPSERALLARLEELALALLHTAAGFGPVFVVTAARTSWVLACASHFLPRVHALLTAVPPAARLQVVSAREWYLQEARLPAPGDPLAWKTAAFEALCSHLQVREVALRRGQRIDLVSVGDAPFEREACARMEQRGPACVRSKTLKLVDGPSLSELADQLAMARALFSSVCQHGAALHLQVTRSAAPGTAPLQLAQVSLDLRLGSDLGPGLSPGLGSGAGAGPSLRARSTMAHGHTVDPAAPLVSPVPGGRG